MYLFTVILDDAGGTYISQIPAWNEQTAFELWVDLLSSKQIADAVSLEVAAGFADPPCADLVPLNGLRSVWCTSASTKSGQLALVNVVGTAVKQSEALEANGS